MGKYRDHRQARRHGSESDQNVESSEPAYFQRRPTAPAPPAVGTAPASDAEVLWFNGEKGFGFVKLSDGSDAFLHVSKLQAVGHNSLPDGALLKVRTEPGQKGAQVVEVVAVELGGGDGQATPAHSSRPASAGARRGAEPLEEEATGVVKSYDPQKGYGFIKMTNGADDVFVHATAISRSGLAALEPGQNVVVRYAQGQKGLDARSLRLV
jgi:CspA family cold shock protein